MEAGGMTEFWEWAAQLTPLEILAWILLGGFALVALVFFSAIIMGIIDLIRRRGRE